MGVSATWGERKGIDVFNKLANDLPDEFEIFIVGVTSDLKSKIDARIHIIERTNSTDELRRLYSIAGVFLNPTIQDNYPTVNLEAAACNTPVITYQTGGSPESSFTPSCVIGQKDYEALKNMLLSRKFKGALKLQNPYQISREYMTERYSDLYIGNIK